ncbi:hypothetical protein D9M73_213540 [compost metagenome]
MAAAALQYHGHLALVVEGVGDARADQRLVVRDEAAVEAREQGRVVRLGVGRFLGVVSVVQADADDLAGLAHQRQVVLLADLDQRALCLGTVGGQVHAAFQQRLQRFLAENPYAFGSTNAQNRATLVREANVTHGADLLLWFVTTARQDGMGSKLIPRKYAVNDKIYFSEIIDKSSLCVLSASSAIIRGTPP